VTGLEPATFRITTCGWKRHKKADQKYVWLISSGDLQRYCNANGPAHQGGNGHADNTTGVGELLCETNGDVTFDDVLT
jgi:hypothetical protein